MSETRDILEFRSSRFAPALPDDCQVNPGVYGAELAWWLCLELAKRGVATSYPEYEDWGWYLEYSPGGDSEFAVHCGNVGGAPDHWLLSLRRYGRKLLGLDKPSYSEAAALVRAIRAVVESEGTVAAVEWHYGPVE